MSKFATVVLLTLSVPASAEVLVRTTDGRVELKAKAEPLSQVLEKLGQAIGMEVRYEGPPPSEAITISFSGRTPLEALTQLLEGRRLDYAVRQSPKRDRVELVLISPRNDASSRPSPSPSVAGSPESVAPVPEPLPQPNPKDATLTGPEQQDREQPSLPGVQYGGTPMAPLPSSTPDGPIPAFARPGTAAPAGPGPGSTPSVGLDPAVVNPPSARSMTPAPSTPSARSAPGAPPPAPGSSTTSVPSPPSGQVAAPLNGMPVILPGSGAAIPPGPLQAPKPSASPQG